MNIRFSLLLLISTFLLQACVTSLNSVSAENFWNLTSSGTSTFDGSKYIKAYNLGCEELVFELYQDTQKSKNRTVLLTAGIREIENIGDGKSLLFKVDGKDYSFSPSSVITEHEKADLGDEIVIDHNIHYSYKTFIVPESFVRKVAESKDFRAKLYLLNNTYVEGKCSPLTMQEALNRADPKYKKYVTEKSLEASNKMSSIVGFQKFIKMMNEM